MCDNTQNLVFNRHRTFRYPAGTGSSGTSTPSQRKVSNVGTPGGVVDQVRVYALEGTDPGDFSTRTSLSDLTVDDQTPGGGVGRSGH